MSNKINKFFSSMTSLNKRRGAKLIDLPKYANFVWVQILTKDESLQSTFVTTDPDHWVILENMKYPTERIKETVYGIKQLEFSEGEFYFGNLHKEQMPSECILSLGYTIDVAEFEKKLQLAA